MTAVRSADPSRSAVIAATALVIIYLPYLIKRMVLVGTPGEIEWLAWDYSIRCISLLDRIRPAALDIGTGGRVERIPGGALAGHGIPHDRPPFRLHRPALSGGFLHLRVASGGGARSGRIEAALREADERPAVAATAAAKSALLGHERQRSGGQRQARRRRLITIRSATRSALRLAMDRPAGIFSS